MARALKNYSGLVLLGASITLGGCAGSDGGSGSDAGTGSGSDGGGLGGLIGRASNGGPQMPSPGGSGGGGEGTTCLVFCEALVVCVNATCGANSVPAGTCQTECAGAEDTIPIGADASCEQIFTAIEVSGAELCGVIDDGGPEGGGGGTGDVAVCCDAIACGALGCSMDPSCAVLIGDCLQEICGAPGEACSHCEDLTKAEVMTCFEGSFPL
ncbi:MAG: hypothetical protein EXR76_10945 [Myxococcales bacterium]|nr:hypothetical protein [Myxococcales bacterium]